MSGLIIEGVAGTGKSTLLQRIKTNTELRKKFPAITVWEEVATLGELVTELRDTELTDEQRCLRLKNLQPEIRQAVQENEFVILERFHHSYYALMPQWHLVDAIDEAIRQLGFVTVLLFLPEDLIEERCLYRAEQHSDFSEQLINWYGSKDKAVEAFVVSQRNRLDMLKKSRLPSLTMDTSQKQWNQYEQDILHFILGG